MQTISQNLIRNKFQKKCYTNGETFCNRLLNKHSVSLLKQGGSGKITKTTEVLQNNLHIG